MNICETAITDLVVVHTSPFVDDRGSFARLFCERELSGIIGDRKILQINHSLTRTTGAVRGLHFQYPPHAEMKLVRCISGRVWDVAVDIRRGSPTFLKWHAEELTPFNRRMIVIPEGFAHGFQVLEPDSQLLYLHTESYAPSSEGGLRFDDPRITIDWPLQPIDLSTRDVSHPWLQDTFEGVVL
jgi:dTDP-4-dehydrorhamnose 3,5-epimerase